MFELIKTVDGLDDIYSSTSFSYKCISDICDLGTDAWIRYFNNINDHSDNAKFVINGEENSLGGISTISIYVKNSDNTYNVYRYYGKLIVGRMTRDNVRHDVLTNIDDIILELREFLNKNESTNEQSDL